METRTNFNNMKFYTLDKPVPNWLLEHRDEIYTDVLEQCEAKLRTGVSDCMIDIALLKTSTGITRFVIKDHSGIIESLTRCMNYFADTEKYELAARTRDCIKDWKNIE
jgi:hypothetical protein